MQPEQPSSLQQLTGRNFRSTAIVCQHCAWAGVAGQLKIPGSAALSNGVTYNCPACATPVARHAGLSQSEIAVELAAIRIQLATELTHTLPVPTKDPRNNCPDGAAAAAPSFASVRARIKELA